jgi:hypothetical protein
VSHHREFGVSRRQLQTILHPLDGHQKTFDGALWLRTDEDASFSNLGKTSAFEAFMSTRPSSVSGVLDAVWRFASELLASGFHHHRFWPEAAVPACLFWCRRRWLSGHSANPTENDATDPLQASLLDPILAFG